MLFSVLATVLHDYPVHSTVLCCVRGLSSSYSLMSTFYGDCLYVIVDVHVRKKDTILLQATVCRVNLARTHQQSSIIISEI